MTNLGQNRWFFAPCDLEIWQMTLKNNRASLLCYFKLCAWFHCHMWIQTGVTVRKLQTSKFGSKSAIFVLCDLEIWQMTLENIRAPHLSYIKLCVSFHSQWSIQTVVIVWKCQIRQFFAPGDLEICQMTLKNNRAPLLCHFKLCAWLHCDMWIQIGVTVRKRVSWVLTSVTLTFDLWLWPFAWTSLLSMVMMIWWWEQWKRCDSRTDRRTDWTSHRAAWS